MVKNNQNISFLLFSLLVVFKSGYEYSTCSMATSHSDQRPCGINNHSMKMFIHVSMDIIFLYCSNSICDGSFNDYNRYKI